MADDGEAKETAEESSSPMAESSRLVEPTHDEVIPKEPTQVEVMPKHEEPSQE